MTKPAAETKEGRAAERDELRGRRALVLGAARSGRAAAALLERAGARVTLADRRAEALPADAAAEIAARGVALALGREDPGLLAGCDLLVVSPGVAAAHPLLAAARAAGIEVMGELELAARRARAPLIAVTGTDGKSTTVTLLGALLAQAGWKAPVAGNVGRALALAVDEVGPEDLLVVEVSSFQLETVSTFRPAVGVLLNVAPDHLDRHPSLPAYRALKLRLFARQEASDVAVVPAGWGDVPGRGRRLAFGPDPALVPLGATVVGGWIVRRTEAGEERILRAGELGIPGPHNLENALAAVAALDRFGLPAPLLATGLKNFRGLPHRLETVAERGGVRFVNDSKATNVHALASALGTFPGGVHLIAGGRDKAGDFESVAPLVRERVARVFRIGEAQRRLAAAWPDVPGEDCANLGAAVARAAECARPGDVVLLAPGCASFDMFRDFEDRGDQFRRLVRELAGAAPAPGATSPGQGENDR
jgi:UDP-N-acetylmuramoylalanine--D-glutamate ligase